MSPVAGADALLARGELLPAARALCEEGRHEEAAEIFSRLCMDAEASACAEHCGDLVGAHRHLLVAKDWARAALIRSRVMESGTRVGDAAILALAGDLAVAGRHGEAAPILEAIGELEAAAGAHRRSGELCAAAALEMLLGRPREAVVLLRAWLEERSSGEPNQLARVHLALSRALARAGELPEAAITLQRLLSAQGGIPPAEREEALGLLVAVLHALDHPAAAEEVFGVLRRIIGLEETDHAAWLRSRGDPLEDTGDDGAGRLVGGRYRLAGLLGSGGTGQVFRAVDEVSRREVAIKLVSGGAEGEALSRFFREARIAAVLDHPGLVRVLEAVPERGYLVMEYLSGGTLEDRLRAGRRLPPARVKEMGLDLCRVLAAIHRRGILHRDVKPANVLFDEAGRPRLGDLGAAHLFSFRQTESGFLLGTLAFMAPEQLTAGKLSAATDVFSLAVTLYRALTGRLPFPGPDIAEQQVEGAPAPSTFLEGLHEACASAVDRVLGSALKVNPEARISSADELFKELSSWPVDDRLSRTGLPSEDEAHEDGRTMEAPRVGTERYEVSARVGARVSLARDRVLFRPVALERFPASDASAWLERVNAISAAGNPHLQALLDVDSDRGVAVWQWIEGEPLSSYAGRAAHTLGDALRIGADLARALTDHPGPIDPGAILVHEGRVTVALAGSEALRDDRAAPVDARPAVGRIVGWILAGLDPGRTPAPLEEIGRRTGEEAPADAAALASWLAIRHATGR